MEDLTRQVSMHEIDPSPIPDDAPGTDSTFTSDPNDKSTSTPPHRPAHSLGLGLDLSHSTTWYLVRAQRYSSYAFTVFATMHITNTSLIPLLTRSVPASEPYLLLTRPYYQSSGLEYALILAPVFLHVVSGVALRIHRRRQEVAMYGAESRREKNGLPWPTVSNQAKAGYALIPLVAGHAFINRVLPLKVHGGSSSVGLSYVAHGVARFPFLSTVGFVALVGTASWHFVWGAARYANLTPGAVTRMGTQGRKERRRRWWGVNALSAFVAGIWMAGGLGIIGRGGAASGWIGREYDDLLRHIPVVGNWL